MSGLELTAVGVDVGVLVHREPLDEDQRQKAEGSAEDPDDGSAPQVGDRGEQPRDEHGDRAELELGVDGVQVEASAVAAHQAGCRVGEEAPGRGSTHDADQAPEEDEGAERLCTHCVIVFVALDGVEGQPTPVPVWTPQNDEDRRLAEYATQVMALSKGIEETVERYRSPAAG